MQKRKLPSYQLFKWGEGAFSYDGKYVSAMALQVVGHQMIVLEYNNISTTRDIEKKINPGRFKVYFFNDELLI